MTVWVDGWQLQCCGDTEPTTGTVGRIEAVHCPPLARAAAQCAVRPAWEEEVRGRCAADWKEAAMDRDAGTGPRLEQHWAASERRDIEAEHAISAAGAILDYSQSEERFR